ncbi:MAG: ATP-binding cassette domain-containing protein [Betaproteobacteria bacterium]|nr:ATP-binding cassette domain-containing protein [Betaproteobacteria bacterium]
MLGNVSRSRCPSAGRTGIVGTNGAGKSTLFAVSGQRRCGQRALRLRGRGHRRHAAVAPTRARPRRTFQVPREFAHLTVRENFLVAARREYGEDAALGVHRRGRVWREETMLVSAPTAGSTS